METKEQGLTKEEKFMFGILGIILTIAIGVLIINSIIPKEQKLDDNKTPIPETSEKKDELVDDSIDEPEDVLIENEPVVEKITYSQVINTSSSQIGANNDKDQSNEEKEQPKELSWTFKETMITQAFEGDIITIEKNVLLEDNTETLANITISKQENENWIEIDISTDSFTVTEGIYKYVYSYGSSTKELLLTVKSKIIFETINLLSINESIEETSNITQEEFTNYQTMLSNTIFENIEGINTLTINNYIDTNNLLPLVLTTNNDLSDKIISTETLGITITQEQNDWHEEITSNSIIIWLDLNTIDLSSNIIDITIDEVIYRLELKIIVNGYQEDISQPDQGELDNNDTGKEENNEDLDDENHEEENIQEDNSDEPLPEDSEDDLEPSPEDSEEEPDPPNKITETEDENSSSITQELEDNNQEDSNTILEQNDSSNETL